jgi:hypothetical protein
LYINRRKLRQQRHYFYLSYKKKSPQAIPDFRRLGKGKRGANKKQPPRYAQQLIFVFDCKYSAKV